MFKACRSPQEVKTLFKKLAFENHPDITGEDTNERMARIITEYKAALKRFDGFKSNEGTRTYYYNEASEDEISQFIKRIISERLQNIVVEIVGTWVWVSGDTRPYAKTFKKLGMRWHAKRKMWYKKPSGARRTRYNESATFDDLKNMYGYKKVTTATGSPLAGLPS